MKEALEEHVRLLVADAQTAKGLEPRDRAFDGAAAIVPADRAAVLGNVLSLAAPAVRPDHLEAPMGQVVVRHVAAGILNGEHEVEQAMHQRALVRAGAAGGHRHRQAAGVDKDHDFHAISRLVRLTSSPPPLALLSVPSMKHS